MINREQIPNQESLLSALQERYNSMHNMRERVQNISLRLLWILLGVSWWIAQSNILFNCDEKIVIVLFIIVLIFIFYKYFEDLKEWIIKQKEIASKIEEKLWFFSWEDSIYPQKRKEKSTEWPFLKSHYLMLWFWFFLLIISILYFT